METFKDLPVLLFATQVDWKNWLEENHQHIPGVWLKHAKKASDKTSVSYLEALEEALCYGWIDSQKQAYDNDYFLQKFTPRGSKSLSGTAKCNQLGLLRYILLSWMADGTRLTKGNVRRVSPQIFKLRWIRIHKPSSFLTP
jgi:hypothetical protein